MKRLFLATCLSGTLGVLGVMAAPAGAVKVHPLSASANAKITHHSKRGHRLSAAQLRKDKAAAGALLRSLKSHRAHSAQVLYYGSVWSDPLDNYDLTDEGPTDGAAAVTVSDCDDIAPYGADSYPECYFYGGSSGVNYSCDMITSYTFTYGLYSCIYLRQDYYEDVSNGVYYGIQLICGTYYPGQESDSGSEGCQYADTYSIESADNGNQYGLFTYEN